MSSKISQDQLKATADLLGVKTEAGLQVLHVLLEQAVLVEGKQKDYGPKNISNFGIFGVIVRMNDKFERLKNLLLEKDADGNIVLKKSCEVANESVEDTFADNIGYSAIGLVVRKGLWPGLEKATAK